MVSPPSSPFYGGNVHSSNTIVRLGAFQATSRTKFGTRLDPPKNTEYRSCEGRIRRPEMESDLESIASVISRANQLYPRSNEHDRAGRVARRENTKEGPRRRAVHSGARAFIAKVPIRKSVSSRERHSDDLILARPSRRD